MKGLPSKAVLWWMVVKVASIIAILIGLYFLAGCAPQQPIIVQSPPVNVNVTIDNGGAPADEARPTEVYPSGKRTWCQEGRPGDPVALSDAVRCMFRDDVDKRTMTPKPQPKSPVVKTPPAPVSQFAWLRGQTTEVRYNSSDCARSSWVPRHYEERVKTDVERGLETRGAAISKNPKTAFTAIVCLANYDKGQERVRGSTYDPLSRSHYSGIYVDRYIAHASIEIVDNAKGVVAARGVGNRLYYYGPQSCWYSESYVPEGETCENDSSQAFLTAARLAMRDLRPTSAYAARTEGSAPASGVERRTD
ncbi:MAG: hypothetical protein HYS44_00990 [Candidatus Niyogibacteria bacterium]|nr:hypothetical protein [Candidatus Niyogibacteria bacterium]